MGKLFLWLAVAAAAVCGADEAPASAPLSEAEVQALCEAGSEYTIYMIRIQYLLVGKKGTVTMTKSGDI